MKYLIYAFSSLMLYSCSSHSESSSSQESIYFPPDNSSEWAVKTPSELGWNVDNAELLYQFLEEKNTKGFIVLVDGRIAIEKYFNNHSATSPWYWASAGKTLTSTAIGIAAQENLLALDDKVSKHLGIGWTSAPVDKENMITIRHLLSMTSGLDDSLGDGVDPSDLQYKADAGSRWAYHNVYVKLQDVIAEASGEDWNSFFNRSLKEKIGMTGAWVANGDLNVYWSNCRSMARFGLLVSNNGSWKTTQIINSEYLRKATSESQQLNPSYGYLWWLNGKQKYMLPQSQISFNGSIINTAPDDMFMALGRDDQKIYIVPSRKLVVIRMGASAGVSNPALSDFDEQLWSRLRAVIN